LYHSVFIFFFIPYAHLQNNMESRSFEMKIIFAAFYNLKKLKTEKVETKEVVNKFQIWFCILYPSLKCMLCSITSFELLKPPCLLFLPAFFWFHVEVSRSTLEPFFIWSDCLCSPLKKNQKSVKNWLAAYAGGGVLKSHPIFFPKTSMISRFFPYFIILCGTCVLHRPHCCSWSV
jgi:hypothetical protein